MSKAIAILCGTLALALPNSANATAGIAPPGASFQLVGGGNLVIGGGTNAWVCQWTFNMQTGASVGGTPPRATGGTLINGTANSAGGGCTVMTVDPSTFSITSSDANGGAGVFHGLSFRQNGYDFCSYTGDVPFQYINNGTAASDVYFPTVYTGPNCTFTADLKTGADLNVVS